MTRWYTAFVRDRKKTTALVRMSDWVRWTSLGPWPQRQFRMRRRVPVQDARIRDGLTMALDELWKPPHKRTGPFRDDTPN